MAAQAINAAVDVVVFGTNSVYWHHVVSRSVEISEERLDEAYQRITSTKKFLEVKHKV